MRNNQAGLVRRSLLIAACAAVPARAYAQGRRLRQDFEGMAAGSPRSGFSVGLAGSEPLPRWMILEDPSAPAGPHVLAAVSRDRTNACFPMAVVKGFKARDVAVTTMFRAVDGRVDQAAGLVVRFCTARNYYVARANALEDNVRRYRVLDGRRIQFAGTDIRVPRDRWQSLGLSVRSDRFEVSFGGRALFGAADRTLPDAGRIGLWTNADSLTHFDTLKAGELG